MPLQVQFDAEKLGPLRQIWRGSSGSEGCPQHSWRVSVEFEAVDCLVQAGETHPETHLPTL